jgi:hypothetical protein
MGSKAFVKLIGVKVGSLNMSQRAKLAVRNVTSLGGSEGNGVEGNMAIAARMRNWIETFVAMYTVVAQCDLVWLCRRYQRAKRTVIKCDGKSRDGMSVALVLSSPFKSDKTVKTSKAILHAKGGIRRIRKANFFLQAADQNFSGLTGVPSSMTTGSCKSNGSGPSLSVLPSRPSSRCTGSLTRFPGSRDLAGESGCVLR